MREEHPIDQYFREALQRAEVQPPPNVWDGVKNGRRRRRGLAFWSRRRGLTVVTLFVALGAGAYWATRTNRTPAPAVTVSTPSSNSTREVVPAPLLTDTHSEAPIAEVTPLPPSRAIDSKERAHTNLAKRTGTHAPEYSIEQQSLLIPMDDSSSGAALTGVILVPASSDLVTPTTEGMAERTMVSPARKVGSVSWMFPLRTTSHGSSLPLAPVGSRVVPPYVLPSSEWWMAVQVGGYDVTRQWTGDNAQLKNALNASEEWTSTVGVGVLVGRTWRSGWGISIGAEHERSEQAFRYVDQWTRVDQEITTSIVYLNTEAFVSHVDTMTTQVFDERVSEGMDRRSVLRIPVEGHWGGSWHRWSYGLGVGVAGEFTSTTSNAILIQDAQDGHIATAPPKGSELRDRYPAVLLGTLSADLGYLLSERWAFRASPVYMHTLGVLGTPSEIFAQPERLGLRLQLSYTFNCHRDR